MSAVQNVVVEKSFDESFSGERVGWISVHDSTFTEGCKLINIATATVSHAGASLSHIEYDGRRADDLYDDAGFESATGLYVAVESDSTVVSRGIYRYIAGRKGESASYIRNNGMREVIADDKHWAHNKEELIDTIKTTLQESGIESVYPYIYYNLNIIGTLRSREFESFMPTTDEVLVPDAAMAEQTTDQVSAASQLLSTINTIKDEDELMARRLTVFSDIPVTEIPDAFVQSREKVAQLERDAYEVVPKIYAASALYLPAGAGPSGGRDWPYMDPNGKTPQDSYGPELGELKSGRTGRASYELTREIAEAKYRAGRVLAGLNLLKQLNELEQQ